MGEDDVGTLEMLRDCREALIEPGIAEHDGRVVKLMGDGFLAEFPSAVEAVACAVRIQTQMRARNAGVPAERQIVFRIGLNIGDVIIEGDDIYGDGVNVAARLEALAEPGGVCVARDLRNQVRDKLDLTWLDRGEVEVKNIARPLRVFAVVLDERAEALPAPARKSGLPGRHRRRGALGLALATLSVVAVGLLWWQPWVLPPVGEAPLANAPPMDRPSIAVLPFSNLGNDPDQEYVADGLTDDLITDLSKISGLAVIARNSVFTYKDRAVDIREAARELGVRYVLEGSVRRAGQAVRINAQLIDGETGAHLWAERYDRGYADIFAIQDEVIRNIVGALSVRLTETERTDVEALPTGSLEAYDYFLRAEKLAYRADPLSAADALRLYQRAIALDPGFADAYAGYARVAVDVLTFSLADNLPSAVARKQAYEAASRAAALNPRSARSYSVLALLQMLEGQHESAIESARRAVALNPSSAEVHLNLAVVLVYAGRPEEALGAMDTVLRLNPKPQNYVHAYHGLTLFMNGREAEAVAAVEQDRDARSSDVGLEVLAVANARLGRREAAREAVDAMLARWPSQNIAYYRALYAHHARAEDLAARLNALRLAGLPAWPFGFEGDPALRLDGAAIDALIRDRSWTGERVTDGMFATFFPANGGFVERGVDSQFSGTAARRGDELCITSPAIMLDRPLCGPVFRSPSGDREGQDAYSYVNGFWLKHFTVSP
jgi:adenylate cyclase